MKDFWIRSFSLAAVVLILISYNQVLKDRDKEEEIAKLEAQIESLELSEEYLERQSLNLQQEQSKSMADGTDTEMSAAYRDGEWQGEAQGFGGTIKVAVTVEAGSIRDIEITSAEGEDKAYLSMAEDIIPKITDAQSADVDTISGATFSSTGIRDAVAEALAQAAR